MISLWISSFTPTPYKHICGVNFLFVVWEGGVGGGWVGGVTSIYICIYIIYIKPLQKTNRPCPGGSPDRKRKRESAAIGADDTQPDEPPAKIPKHSAKKHRVPIAYRSHKGLDYKSLQDLHFHLQNQCGRKGVFKDGSRFSWMAVDVGVDANRPRILKRGPDALGLDNYAFGKASPPPVYILYIYNFTYIYIYMYKGTHWCLSLYI